jgi:mono/diheme cytochrome c family protein
MPADVFYYLNDADLGAIIAFLRSVAPATDTLPSTEIRVLGRMRLVRGIFRPAIAGLIDQAAARMPTPPPGDSIALGSYLAHTTCAGCHGADLRGDPDPDDASPNLAIVSAYSRADFAHLMRTGEPIGHRTLREMMANAAKCCLSHFTDEEIGAVYAYLRSIGSNTAGSPPGPG